MPILACHAGSTTRATTKVVARATAGMCARRARSSTKVVARASWPHLARSSTKVVARAWHGALARSTIFVVDRATANIDVPRRGSVARATTKVVDRAWYGDASARYAAEHRDLSGTAGTSLPWVSLL